MHDVYNALKGNDTKKSPTPFPSDWIEMLDYCDWTTAISQVTVREGTDRTKAVEVAWPKPGNSNEIWRT